MNPVDPSVMQAEQPSSAASAGQMLRAAREARGVHLAMLSVNLKVSVRKLEALEADQYDAFKGIAFVRALAQSVCRQLKIDPVPVLQALPRSDAPTTLQPVALEAHSTAVVTSAHPGVNLVLPRQVLLLAVLMLLGVGALIWWPNSRQDVQRVTEAIHDSVQAAVPLGQASDPVETVAPPASAALPGAPSASSAPAQAAPAAPKPQSFASSPAPAVAPSASSAAAVSSPAASQGSVASKESPLLIKVSADVWISVRDNQGQIVFKRQVKAGETVKLDLPSPLFVYAGRADATELLWRGKPMDLQPYTQNNEVRLHIKS